MNLGFPEMLFIFGLALLIFGPKKLPEIGRQVGKAMAEFKKASSEFQHQIESEVRQLEIEEVTPRTIAPPPDTVPVAALDGIPTAAPAPSSTVPELSEGLPASEPRFPHA